jgi:hypothetical protein
MLNSEMSEKRKSFGEPINLSRTIAADDGDDFDPQVVDSTKDFAIECFIIVRG